MVKHKMEILYTTADGTTFSPAFVGKLQHDTDGTVQSGHRSLKLFKGTSTVYCDVCDSMIDISTKEVAVE